jgi:hypothetical protein
LIIVQIIAACCQAINETSSGCFEQAGVIANTKQEFNVEGSWIYSDIPYRMALFMKKPLLDMIPEFARFSVGAT